MELKEKVNNSSLMKHRKSQLIMTAAPIETDAGLERGVQEAFACAQSSLGGGRLATYIPELGRVDPSKLGASSGNCC